MDTTPADFKVDDALFFIGLLEIGGGDRAAGLDALEQLIADYPGSERRPRAMYTLACERALDGRLNEGHALAQALATEYNGTALDAPALHWAICYLLGPEANAPEAGATDEDRAQNVSLAKTDLDVLVAMHPGERETAMGLEQMMWHHLNHNEGEDAALVARQILVLFSGVEPGVADSALYDASQTEIDYGDRPVGLAALERTIREYPDFPGRPASIGTLAWQRAADNELDRGDAIAESLIQEYTDKPLEPQALASAAAYWLWPWMHATDECPGIYLAKAKATIDLLTRKYPQAPETAVMQDALLYFHLHRFEHEEAEPIARRIINLFPDTVDGMKGRRELAELVVELRGDFETAHRLLDEALVWARDNGDLSLEAKLMWSRSRVLVREGRCLEGRDVAWTVVFTTQEHAGTDYWADWLLPRAETQVAYSFFMDEQYVTAADEFARLLVQYAEKDKWHPFWTFYVGLSWLEAGEHEMAKAAFTRLVEDHPEDGWAYAGWLLMQGQIPEPLCIPPEESTDERQDTPVEGGPSDE